MLSEGRHQFETAGLRKTSVEDLTKAAGIAQGSFYMFFASKEELYYELLLEEEQRIRNTVLDLFPLMRFAARKASSGFFPIH